MIASVFFCFLFTVITGQDVSQADNTARLRGLRNIQQQQTDQRSAGEQSKESTRQVNAGQQPANPTQEIAREQPEGPALEIGPARLRIGGYLGVTGIYRSTNSGGGTGTSFASITY